MIEQKNDVTGAQSAPPGAYADCLLQINASFRPFCKPASRTNYTSNLSWFPTMILPIENWPSPCKEVAPTLPAAMEDQPPCSWSSPPQGWGLSGRHTDPTTTSLHAVACHPPHHLIQTRFSTHGTRVFRIKTLEKAYTPTGPWAGGCDSFHLPIQPASSQGRRLGIQSPIPPHLFFFLSSFKTTKKRMGNQR